LITVRRKEDDFRYSQHLVANAVFAFPALIGGVQNSNFTGLYEATDDYLASPFGDIEDLNLFPKSELLGNSIADLSSFVRYLDWKRDFNGHIRNHRYIGAYRGAGESPGWRLRLGRKP